jgi:hypothetical protein
MESVPTCRHCGEPMTFATRISMPRQTVYQCERCKTQAWILDRRVAPAQQQQQPQKKDGQENQPKDVCLQLSARL